MYLNSKRKRIVLYEILLLSYDVCTTKSNKTSSKYIRVVIELSMTDIDRGY